MYHKNWQVYEDYITGKFDGVPKNYLDFLLLCFNSKRKVLSIHAFTDKQKREAYEKQKGKCVKCKERFEIEEMEADHIKP